MLLGRITATVAIVSAFAFITPVSAQTRAVATRDTAVFAGGCFWGVQAVFARVKGVVSSISGYSGGTMINPSYEDVSTGSTGHAESVQVIYDPAKVSYSQLLEVFFGVAHDPTQLNFQGPDHGTQYRSAILFRSPAQQTAANAHIAKLTQTKQFTHPIVTEVSALRTFYPAEAYHQGYFDTHPDQPYIVYNDKPKVAALKKQFAGLYNGK